MTPSDWAVVLPSLVGMLVLAGSAPEPGGGNGADLDGLLVLFTILPWV